ncbi:efflux RND transporter periplasmic adaptor subunit [Dyadobacter psychrotolerans]|uniref:Efflux RND transporter periplasmic adaptor subunit n=1 Tax=Dyadobacter psychrotolerans TaxID=2541721 RepID=A0A4V2Z424_9BACT|nr:efflux RND transporter periplasmic adaptor subunit [Dyadobacter psychrotolerans]TDE14468.1 efflux RND transporter periplasmic adaptor subunit [Dyadobacter psychrotolerans]
MKRYTIICLSLLVLASCGTDPKSEVAETKNKADSTNSEQTVSFSAEQLKSVGIEVGTPQLEKISGVLNLQGTIDVPPQSTVSLSFPLGGYLKFTKMLPGMHVRKGQVLAVLEDMQFIQLQQDYLTAKEKFTLSETEFSRQRDLNTSKASSDKVYQQSRAEMETQRILMNALGQKLEVIGINPVQLKADNISKSVSILSPINGYVSKVNVNVGKYTSPTDMLFELVDPRDIHLALNVFEKDLGTLAIGQHVTAYTNSEPGKKFQAEIILISKNLDQDRMAEVHCHFEQYSPSLVPGMFINGEVSVDNKEALTVPEEAVVRWENRFFVFTDSGNGKFEMTEVKPGVISKGKQQIEAAGIDESTRLVVKNAYALLMKIKNTEEEG